MTTLHKEYKALVLGDVWEVDHIFTRKPFEERFVVEVIYVDDVDEFREAIEDPDIDLVLIDVDPHGLDVLEVVLERPPMRPVIMVADRDEASVILDAKDKGLERYVIRLDDDQMNVDLLGREITSVFEQIAQPPTMKHPTIGDLFRYAQFHNVRQPFYIVDLHRRLLYVNAAGVELVERLHDCRAELGAAPEAFFLDDTAAAFEAHLDRAFEGEEVEFARTFEQLPEQEKYREVLYQPVRLDGGDVIAVSVACRNIGARREAQERLRQREEALWSYFDAVPLPLQVVAEDLTVERCNPAFLELLGMNDAEQIDGHPIEDFVHPDDLDGVKDLLVQLLSGDETYFQAEHRYCDARDMVAWVNHVGFSIRGIDEQPDRVLMIAVDVTRQKEAEQRAEQSMRMEAIGELAGGVAHDFNNVLAIVTALGHVLKEQLTEMHEDKLVEHVDKMQQAIESGASLTHQLLSFSQKDRVDQEVIDLNYRLREISQLLERALGDDVDMRLELEPDLAPVEIGKGQIDQVSMNLVVNARDAMADGGEVQITTRQVHVDPQATPPRADLEPGEFVVLEIADTGVGMNRETKRRIFDPFFTTKGPGEGTGMGLATVYRIVEASGGKIYVDSKPGAGTTFTIYFPAAARPEGGLPSDEEREPPETATPASSGSILLVEDEEDIREPYCIFLEAAGYEVLEAANLEQARAAVEEAKRPIHLLLADVVLPDGSGVDLAKELAEHLPELRVLFISGYAPDLLYRGEEDAGEQWAFLPKPVSREKLLSTVSETLEAPRTEE